MGKKDKSKAIKKAREHEQVTELNDITDGASTPSFVFSDADDDDEEANQDLSLKIVEKALQTREAKLTTNESLLNGISSVVSPPRQPELLMAQSDAVLDGPCGISALEVTEENKSMKLRVDSADQSVISAAEQEVEEIIKATENHESVETSADQIGDNMVLRKLLRGPRYFDPPDNSSWGACYNCGEEGHAAVNCTAAKRKKPCYVCGDLGHGAKQCTKAQSCYICKKGGHRAKDCPEKNMTARASKSLMVCLKCGNSGHDMFSCRNDYSLDDLKEIQCYTCKAFGHLCCVDTADEIPGEFSCYKCGQIGHTGLACSRLQGETTGAATPTLCYRCGEEGHFARECTNSIKVQGETTGAATPTLCYRCGEEGHFARECTNSIKVRKKNSELSNRKHKRSYNENDYIGHWSAPHDMGKMHKKKRPLTDERGFSTPKKSKSRGGWTTDFHAEERVFTTPKKTKSRGGWSRELPTEERGYNSTTSKKSKSRGGWTTEHPAEERDFQTPKKFNGRGGWTTEHSGEFSSSNSKRSSWRSPATPSARSTNMHASGSGSSAPGWSSKSSKVWTGRQPEASNSHGSAGAFYHRYAPSRFGNYSDDGYRRSNSASRFGNSNGERSNWW